MNICVIGTGYVGLVSGTGLSDFGMNVVCVDKDKNKIEMLNRGVMPIYEIGLKELVDRNVKRERLSFSTDIKKAIKENEIIFIGVGTPEQEDGSTNMAYVNKCAEDIGRFMNGYKVIVTKSTVPVGTAKKIRQIISENQTDEFEFDVVSNPEFLREGSAVNDFMHPDRVIIGTNSEKAFQIVKEIYRPLYLLKTPIVGTTNETAELAKYAANTLLAVKISYINEIANLCDRVGADVYQVATAVGMDKRIGPKFLHPGPGFGGSCFPKDVKSIVHLSNEEDYDFLIGKAVLEVNQRQKEQVVTKISDSLKDVKGKTVTLLGLSFKPNTDDVREAPALYVAQRLMDMGATINAYDPVAMEAAQISLAGLNYFNSVYEACVKSDIAVIMTEWNEFRDLDFEKLDESMNSKIIYDTRNIYNAADITKLGFTYLCTGRPVT